jgi:hypothetical protein
MVKLTASIRVITLLLLAACGAWCQKRTADGFQGVQSESPNAPEARRQMSTWKSLPDAPSSVQPAIQPKRFQTLVNDASPPITGAASVATRVTQPEQVAPAPQSSLSARYRAAFTPAESIPLLGRYLNPRLLQQNPRSYGSTSTSLMGRASYAAARTFITHDESGKGRLNTSYFLGVLSSVVNASARRPYWARSTSGAFNNFGSTIGSDAGMNVFHEFGPAIRQTVKGFTPKFMSRIEERIAGDQTPRRDLISIPAR